MVLKLHSTCSEEKFIFIFFRSFRRHFPDFEQPILRKNARTTFHVISDTFCKKIQKTSILRLLIVFQEQYFGRVDKTTFHLTRGIFWKQNVFLQKTYTMKFLTFSSKKLPTLRRKKSHSVDVIAFDEHGETMWKKIIFLKKTVCSQICYRLRAGILLQFSRRCFLHIQGYTSGRKCRPKKRTINFVFEM